MKQGLKGGILIDADSGPPRYVLWCCGGICHQVLTFIQIGCGHTVAYDISYKEMRRFHRIGTLTWTCQMSVLDWTSPAKTPSFQKIETGMQC